MTLEYALQVAWGHVLLVSLLYPDDPKVQASFKEVEEAVKATNIRGEK